MEGRSVALPNLTENLRKERDTHDDIDGFVQVDDDTVFVDDWHGRNSLLAEEMDDVKDGGVQSGGQNRVERVLLVRIDVCPNAKTL